MDHSIEIEVKFYVPQVDPLREHLLTLGASCMGRVFERNICFENEAGNLKARDILLRLRKDSRASLTFKAPPREMDGDFKMYKEMEVEVGDFDTCQAILEALGFRPAQTYEKWRETFVLGDTHLLLDTTPFGVFLEIEGQKRDIRTVAERLGFSWKERILLNYLAMFEMIRRGEGLSFKDMTFANFESRACGVISYVPAMFAGVRP